MQLENFIQLIIRHNAQIIEALVGTIVFVVLFLAYRSFMSAKDAELSPAGAGSLISGDLEGVLKKILEKANAMPSGSHGGDSTPLMQEISVLKESLEQKQEEIERLRNAAPSEAAGSVSDNLKSALEAQLKELQGKLAEYEIISEDIADLSFYKEENVKLQKEITTLKETGPARSAPTTPSAPAPVAATAISGAPSAKAESPPETELSELTPIPEMKQPMDAATAAGVDDDIMKEFAAAVEEQTPLGETPEAGAGGAAPAEAPEGVIDLGEMDMEKMVAEAVGLEAVKVDESMNALEDNVDPNKLLEEAASMDAVKPDDVQLMNDFESFKKGQG